MFLVLMPAINEYTSYLTF